MPLSPKTVVVLTHLAKAIGRTAGKVYRVGKGTVVLGKDLIRDKLLVNFVGKEVLVNGVFKNLLIQKFGKDFLKGFVIDKGVRSLTKGVKGAFKGGRWLVKDGIVGTTLSATGKVVNTVFPHAKEHRVGNNFFMKCFNLAYGGVAGENFLRGGPKIIGGAIKRSGEIAATLAMTPANAVSESIKTGTNILSEFGSIVKNGREEGGDLIQKTVTEVVEQPVKEIINGYESVTTSAGKELQEALSFK